MTTIRCLQLLTQTRRHPSAILLLVQLMGMLLYPFIEEQPIGHTAFNIFGIVILALTVRMVRRTPGETWVSITLGVPIVALLALQTFFDMRDSLLPWSSGLEALFYFYAAGSLIAYMMGDHRATTDELFAAAATFTLLAWAFTHLFLLLQALQPGTFIAALDASAPRSWTEMNYLSFAILSGVGLSDIVPVRPLGRALCSVEMLAGLMYLASVVGRLIGFSTQARIAKSQLGAPREACKEI